MIPIAQLVDENRRVVESLHRFSFREAARLIASLAVIPDFHANTIRIEALIQLAAVACQGDRSPNCRDLAKWIGSMRNTAITHEDPVEDVFVGCVNSRLGTFRIFIGVVCDPDFWIERLLKFVAEKPSFPTFDVATERVLNLLSLSEAMARRLGLGRYITGGGKAAGQIRIPRWRDLARCYEALFFSDAELQESGVDRLALGNFILSEEDRAEISQGNLFSTNLDRKPLAYEVSGVTILAPSCIARAAIWYLIDTVSVMGGWGDTFHQIGIAETFVNDVLHPLGIEHLNFSGPSWPGSLPPMFVYFGRFDTAKPVIGLNYVSEPTETAKNFGGEEALSAEQQRDLETYLRTCAQQLETDPNFSGGLILCNIASVRSASFYLSLNLPKWRVHIATLPDWFVLVHSGECSAMRLWKLSEHEADLHSRKIHLFNLAGLVNLFAFWKRHGFRLIPQNVDSRTLNVFNLECDFAIQMRADVRQSHDAHGVRSHGNDHWVRLVRHNVRSLFAEDSEYKLYADWDAIRDGRLVGCIEGNTLWWISVPPIQSNAAVKDLVFQLWDCALHWLARLVPIAEQRWGSVLPRSIQIDMQMPDVSNWRVDRRASDLLEAAELQVTPEPHNAQILVGMPEGFLKHFNTPKSVAEKRIVDALFAGMAALIGEDLSVSQFSELTRQVIPNEDARYFHITNAQRLEQFFAQPGRPDPLFVQDEDLAIARIGLADLVGRPADSDSVEGLPSCRVFLKDLVAKVWERIETRLKGFSRSSVVTGCLRSLDEVARDEEHWDMTARSLFAMHSDTAEVHKIIRRRRSERSQANVCNRLIVEVAQYSCGASPDARLLNRSNHLAMLADMTVLLQLAHHRDAIAFGFVEPRVKIFPNGEIDIDEKFYVEILNRYLTHRSEEITRRAAESYEERFSASSIDEGQVAALIEKLSPTFIMEFGFNIDSLFTLLESLRDAAVEIRASGGLTSESDLRSILKHSNFSCAGCDSFLRRFVLPIRSAWNADLPEGSHT